MHLPNARSRLGYTTTFSNRPARPEDAPRGEGADRHAEELDLTRFAAPSVEADVAATARQKNHARLGQSKKKKRTSTIEIICECNSRKQRTGLTCQRWLAAAPEKATRRRCASPSSTRRLSRAQSLRPGAGSPLKCRQSRRRHGW